MIAGKSFPSLLKTSMHKAAHFSPSVTDFILQHGPNRMSDKQHSKTTCKEQRLRPQKEMRERGSQMSTMRMNIYISALVLNREEKDINTKKENEEELC